MFAFAFYCLIGSINDSTSYELMKYFIDKDVDNNLIKTEGFDNMDSFLRCQEYKSNEVIVFKDETLLHITCRRGFIQLSSYLLSLGVSPLILDSYNKTALDYSIAAGHSLITKSMYPKVTYRYHKAIDILAYAIRKFLIRKLKYG